MALTGRKEWSPEVVLARGRFLKSGEAPTGPDVNWPTA